MNTRSFSIASASLFLLATSACALKPLDTASKARLEEWATSVDDLATGLETAETIVLQSSDNSGNGAELNRDRIARRGDEKAQARRARIDERLTDRTQECAPQYQKSENGRRMSFAGPLCPARMEIKTLVKREKDGARRTQGFVSFELLEGELRDSVSVNRAEVTTDVQEQSTTKDTSSVLTLSGVLYGTVEKEVRISGRIETTTRPEQKLSSTVTRLQINLPGMIAELTAETQSIDAQTTQTYRLNGAVITAAEAELYGMGLFHHFRYGR